MAGDATFLTVLKQKTRLRVRAHQNDATEILVRSCLFAHARAMSAAGLGFDLYEFCASPQEEVEAALTRRKGR